MKFEVFTIAQLISYIVTGDSGNYSTSFNLIGFYENNPIATVNLPSFAGVNTGTLPSKTQLTPP